MATATYRNIVEGPRWAGFPSVIRDGAFQENLDLTINVEKGFLTEKVRFVVTGEAPNVERFRRNLLACIKEYNAD
jgi:hypothetical protein